MNANNKKTSLIIFQLYKDNDQKTWDKVRLTEMFSKNNFVLENDLSFLL